MSDGRAEDPPVAMVDTGLLNNFVPRWFVGLVQYLRRLRTIESHTTKYSLNSLTALRVPVGTKKHHVVPFG